MLKPYLVRPRFKAYRVQTDILCFKLHKPPTISCDLSFPAGLGDVLDVQLIIFDSRGDVGVGNFGICESQVLLDFLVGEIRQRFIFDNQGVADFEDPLQLTGILVLLV